MCLYNVLPCPCWCLDRNDGNDHDKDKIETKAQTKTKAELALLQILCNQRPRNISAIFSPCKHYNYNSSLSSDGPLGTVLENTSTNGSASTGDGDIDSSIVNNNNDTSSLTNTDDDDLTQIIDDIDKDNVKMQSNDKCGEKGKGKENENIDTLAKEDKTETQTEKDKQKVKSDISDTGSPSSSPVSATRKCGENATSSSICPCIVIRHDTRPLPGMERARTFEAMHKQTVSDGDRGCEKCWRVISQSGWMELETLGDLESKYGMMAMTWNEMLNKDGPDPGADADDKMEIDVRNGNKADHGISTTAVELSDDTEEEECHGADGQNSDSDSDSDLEVVKVVKVTDRPSASTNCKTRWSNISSASTTTPARPAFFQTPYPTPTSASTLRNSLGSWFDDRQVGNSAGATIPIDWDSRTPTSAAEPKQFLSSRLPWSGSGSGPDLRSESPSAGRQSTGLSDARASHREAIRAALGEQVSRTGPVTARSGSDVGLAYDRTQAAQTAAIVGERRPPPAMPPTSSPAASPMALSIVTARPTDPKKTHRHPSPAHQHVTDAFHNLAAAARRYTRANARYSSAGSEIEDFNEEERDEQGEQGILDGAQDGSFQRAVLEYCWHEKDMLVPLPALKWPTCSPAGHTEEANMMRAQVRKLRGEKAKLMDRVAVLLEEKAAQVKHEAELTKRIAHLERMPRLSQTASKSHGEGNTKAKR